MGLGEFGSQFGNSLSDDWGSHTVIDVLEVLVQNSESSDWDNLSSDFFTINLDSVVVDHVNDDG